MKPKVYLIIALRYKMVEQLSKEAKSHGISVDEWCRVLLYKHLRERKKNSENA
jgi:hypothetical protein